MQNIYLDEYLMGNDYGKPCVLFPSYNIFIFKNAHPGHVWNLLYIVDEDIASVYITLFVFHHLFMIISSPCETIGAVTFITYFIV